MGLHQNAGLTFIGVAQVLPGFHGFGEPGVQISGPFLAQAFTSPVTLGILAGYVLGKPLGIPTPQPPKEKSK